MLNSPSLGTHFRLHTLPFAAFPCPSLFFSLISLSFQDTSTNPATHFFPVRTLRLLDLPASLSLLANLSGSEPAINNGQLVGDFYTPSLQLILPPCNTLIPPQSFPPTENSHSYEVKSGFNFFRILFLFLYRRPFLFLQFSAPIPFLRLAPSADVVLPRDTPLPPRRLVPLRSKRRSRAFFPPQPPFRTFSVFENHGFLFLTRDPRAFRFPFFL